jgi:glc operon protein GlcG
MKYLYLVILALCSAITITKAAYSLEMKPVISLELAKKMADACEAHKETKDWNPINIAIVDAGADLILFRREDSAFLGSIDIAINKAISSAMIPRSTRKVGELAYGENGDLGPRPGVATVDFLVPFAGGLPIRTDSGHLLGAIGVSGASSDQDEECAQAAIDAVRSLLK